MDNFFPSVSLLPAPIVDFFTAIFASIWTVWSYTWWFFLPIILGMILWESWMYYVQYKWLKSIKWVLLEIKVPKNILKTPKAMEQIFAAAHTPYSYGLRWQDHYFKGVNEWFMSFELVGKAGETHFYLRLPQRFRNMMESAIFAQYPDAEIVEAEDYLKEMPKVLPNEEFDLAGYEVVFRKPDWYPLRTYVDFEEAVEEQRIDPIAPLIEGMEKMQGDQQLWVQFVIEPTGEEFAKGGEEEIKKIHGIVEEKKKHQGLFSGVDLGFTLGEALRAPFEHPGEAHGKSEEKARPQPRLALSAFEKERSEGIARKISKLALKTTIRVITIEKYGENPNGLMSNLMLTLSYLRQFNNQTLQMTRPDGHTRTFSIYGLMKKYKQRSRKHHLFEHYHYISQNHHAPILNIEELATLFHFPITAVSSTGLEKIESKKGSPPGSLPMVPEDEIDE